MVIFHSYVKLPEGKGCFFFFRLNAPNDNIRKKSSTGWGPSSLAKLVNITITTIVYDT